MDTYHLIDFSNLLFEHRDTMSDYKYISMCDTLKNMHTMVTTATIKRSRIVQDINTRIERLRAKYNYKMQQEYLMISKPRINNVMKFVALYDMAKVHELISEKVQVIMSMDNSKPASRKNAKTYLEEGTAEDIEEETAEDIDEETAEDIDEGIQVQLVGSTMVGQTIRIDDELRYVSKNDMRGVGNLYDTTSPPNTIRRPGKRTNRPRYPLLKTLVDTIVHHLGMNKFYIDYMKYIEKIQYCVWINKRNDFFYAHLEPILDEIENLEDLLGAL